MHRETARGHGLATILLKGASRFNGVPRRTHSPHGHRGSDSAPALALYSTTVRHCHLTARSTEGPVAAAGAVEMNSSAEEKRFPALSTATTFANDCQRKSGKLEVRIPFQLSRFAQPSVPRRRTFLPGVRVSRENALERGWKGRGTGIRNVTRVVWPRTRVVMAM